MKNNNREVDAIMFDAPYIDPTFYKFNFIEWDLNDAAGHDVDVLNNKITIKKFKPNCWIIKSPAISGIANTAICKYIHGTIMSSTNIDSYNDIFSISESFSNNAGAGNDIPNFRGFCPYPMNASGIPAPALDTYTWENCWSAEGVRDLPGLADYPGFRLGSGGHGTYGIWKDFKDKLMFPDELYDFPTYYRSSNGGNNTINWHYGFMLATGLVNNFDDGTWLLNRNVGSGTSAVIQGNKVIITGRSTIDASGWHVGKWTNPRASKIKVTGLQEGDRLGYGRNNGWQSANTYITEDGIYNIPAWSNGGSNGFGYKLFGTGTSDVTIEYINDITDENGLIDISDNPIIIELPVTEKGVDLSSVECWDAYCGEELVYHKDKTIDNCWNEYGYLSELITVVSEENDSDYSYYSVNMQDAPTNINKFILPEVTDLELHILPKNNAGIAALKWNHEITNTEFWDKIKDYLATHPVICVNDRYENKSNYTPLDNNHLILSNWFNNAKISGDLTIKFDGNSLNFFCLNWLNYAKLDTLTIQALQDNINISSTQFLFRNLSVKNIVVLDKSGNPYSNFLKAFDCSAMFENSDITYFPDIINWKATRQLNEKYWVPLQYAFSYCNKLQEIAMHGTDRYSADNSITVYYGALSFQYCMELTKIGPVLNLACVNFLNAIDPDADGYKMFSHCGSLTDVRIKNLNGSYVNFDDNNKHGNLPALDEESIQYLFDNLTDLSSYDADIAKSTVNNDWTCSITNGYDYFWIENLEFTHLLYRTIAKVENSRRLPETSSLNDKWIYTTEAVNTTINVTGLVEGDILTWVSGEQTTVLTNGEHVITNPQGVNGGFSLRRIGNTIVDDYGHIVSIRFVKVHNIYAPKAPSAELHVPETWDDKITDRMILSASNKKWKIYVGGELRTVSN